MTAIKNPDAGSYGRIMAPYRVTRYLYAKSFTSTVINTAIKRDQKNSFLFELNPFPCDAFHNRDFFLICNTM